MIGRWMNGVLVLACLAAGCTQETPSKESDDMASETLRTTTPIETTLESGQSRSFLLRLDEGDWVEVVVAQLGLDVEVELFTPGGVSMLSVDTPIGREGDERLVAVAAGGGEHRVEVRAVENEAPPGRFRIEVVDVHPATDEDRARAEAERIFSQAEGLRRRGTEDSRRQAVELYGQTLDRWRELGMTGRMADATHRLGWVANQLGDKNAAVTHFETAVDLYRQAADPRGEAIVLNTLAATHLNLGDQDEALRNVTEALDLLQNPSRPSLEAPTLVAGCLSNLASIQRARGEIGEALDTYRQALTLAEARDDRRERAVILGSLAVLLLDQDLLDSAEDRLQAAADAWNQLGNPRAQGSIWNLLGFLAKRRAGEAEGTVRLEHLDEALDAHRTALELKRRAGDERGEGIALDSLGTNYLLKGDHEPAREHYEKALDVFRRLELAADEARTLLNLGRLHQETGEFQQALHRNLEAEPMVKSHGDPQLQASNLYGIAQAYQHLGRPEKAQERVTELLEIVEGLREATGRESFRLAFFASKQQYYELAIDLQMNREPTRGEAPKDKAFALVERRRARTLLDLLGEERRQIRKQASPELLEREARLQAELNRAAGAEKPADHELRRLREELEATRESIRNAAPDDLLRSPETVDLATAQYLATDPDTQLLVYSLGEEQSYLWLLSHEAETFATDLRPRREIEDAAFGAHRALQSASHRRAERNGRRIAELSELILDPVADRLTAKRLVVVADGALLNIPFAALPLKTTGAELIRSHEVVHLPSVSVLSSIHRHMRRRGVAPEQLLIFADPVFTPPGERDERSPSDRRLTRSLRSLGLDRLPPLPATGREAEEIESVARGSVRKFVRYQATKSNLLSQDLSRFQMLHFATHGLVQREHPELSGLVFSLYDEAGERLDGFLRLHEIYNLQLDAELVVLSACRTALGRRVRGEGMLGLSRGFLYAGAPRLLISHWSVDDEETMELMRRFYLALLDLRASPSAALRAAQISMLDSDDPRLSLPVAWAGFTFQGEWRKYAPHRPIEPTVTGSEIPEKSDIDFPPPDTYVCESLEEDWQKEVCRALRELLPGSGD